MGTEALNNIPEWNKLSSQKRLERISNQLEEVGSDGNQAWQTMEYGQLGQYAKALLEEMQGFYRVDSLETALEKLKRGDDEGHQKNRRFFELKLLQFIQRHLKLSTADPSQEVFSATVLNQLKQYFVEREKSGKLTGNHLKSFNEIKTGIDANIVELCHPKEVRGFRRGVWKKEADERGGRYRTLRKQIDQLYEWDEGIREKPKWAPAGAKADDMIKVLEERIIYLELTGMDGRGVGRAEKRRKSIPDDIQELIRQQMLAGALGEEVMQGFTTEARGELGEAFLASWMRRERARTGTEIERFGTRRFVEAKTLALFLNLQATGSIERQELVQSLLHPEIAARYGDLVGGTLTYSLFDRKEMSGAIGKLADALGKIGHSCPETQELGALVCHRHAIRLETNEGVLEGTISIGDFMDYIDSPETFKYKGKECAFRDGFMSKSSKVREAALNAIKWRLLEENLGLTDQHELLRSNLTLPIDEETGESRFVSTREDLEFYLGSMAEAAQTLLLFHGRALYLDTAIDGYWPYSQRSVLNIIRYLEMYSVFGAGARKYYETFYGSFWGSDLAKIHPLLMSAEFNEGCFDIKHGGASVDMIEERKKDLDWILRSYALKDEYKIAAGMIAKGEDTFINPVTKKQHDISTPEKVLEFVRKHKAEFADYCAPAEAFAKIELLEKNNDFVSRWEGVPFRLYIERALRVKGKEAEIERLVDSMCVGVEGLKRAVKEGSYNLFLYDNPLEHPTNITKWWRYLAGVEATIPFIHKIFQSFNIVSRERIRTGESVRAEVEAAAEEMKKSLQELGGGGFPHMDHEQWAFVFEGLLKGMVEMTKKEKGVHRHKINVSSTGNRFDLVPLNADSVPRNRLELMRGLGWRTSRIEKANRLIAGTHLAYEVELSEDALATQAKQFGTRMVTQRDFEDILSGLVDAGLLTENAKEILKTRYINYFKKAEELKSKEKVGTTAGFIGGTIASAISGGKKK